MKIRKKRIALGVIITIILCSYLLLKSKSIKDFYQEDLVFFRLFHTKISKDNNLDNLEMNKKLQKSNIVLELLNKQTDKKEVILSDTIEERTLVHEKIAPRN